MYVIFYLQKGSKIVSLMNRKIQNEIFKEYNNSNGNYWYPNNFITFGRIKTKDLQ